VNSYFIFALVLAAIGLAVAGRFLYLAWSDYHFGRDRRERSDRRRRRLPVPMERRKRSRRD
jgi:hypothetical protein